MADQDPWNYVIPELFWPGSISLKAGFQPKNAVLRDFGLAGFFAEPSAIHLGDFFIADDDIGLWDFQAVHWGNGIRDVQYFLADSRPLPVLAANEKDLLRYYVGRRSH